MPRKTRSTPSRSKTPRRRSRQNHAGTVDARTRSKDRPKSGQIGEQPAGLRINITKTGSKVRFWFVDQNDLTVTQSRGYDTPGAAKAKLIDFIKAIQADDFETFDHT